MSCNHQMRIQLVDDVFRNQKVYANFKLYTTTMLSTYCREDYIRYRDLVKKKLKQLHSSRPARQILHDILLYPYNGQQTLTTYNVSFAPTNFSSTVHNMRTTSYTLYIQADLHNVR